LEAKLSGVFNIDLKEYFANARRFDQDRLTSIVRQRNAAIGVAALAILGVVACGVGIAALAPLKEKILVPIVENKVTGLPEILSTLNETTETEPEILSKYFLTQYLTARESYLDAEASFAFHKVSVMSSPNEQKRFGLWYNPSNPESPQLLYGKKEVAEVHIRAISLLSPGLAQVRFTRIARDVDGDQTKGRRSDYAATIEFHYEHKLKMTEADRLLNPLGFWVTSYRVDVEVAQ
jgi:type IV secretion system protein VirB8